MKNLSLDNNNNWWKETDPAKEAMYEAAMSESAQIAISAVQSLLVILNIAGNSLVCVIIVKNQDMRYVGKLGTNFVRIKGALRAISLIRNNFSFFF